MAAARRSSPYVDRETLLRTRLILRIPMPGTPAPGPYETAVCLMLARVVPFRREVQRVLARRLGVGGYLTPQQAAQALGVTQQNINRYEQRLAALLARTGPPPALLETPMALPKQPHAGRHAERRPEPGAVPIDPRGVRRLAQLAARAPRRHAGERSRPRFSQPA